MDRPKVKSLDRSLEALSDEEIDALIERARQRACDLSEDEVAAIIAEAIRAVRAQSRGSSLDSASPPIRRAWALSSGV